MDSMSKETIEKVRAAIKDRATWFALLYEAFEDILPEAEVEKACRKAIFKFGELKAKKDPEPFSHGDWVRRHEEKGSALVFDSEIERRSDHSVQRMRFCPLTEAWKELGLGPERIDKLCDIAMEGDRGRAAAHGLAMTLDETLAKGGSCCRLVIRER